MIILDYKDKRPIFEQVTEKLKKLIASGAFSPEGKLPSVRSLAVELAINPNTISRAYHELETDGYIYTVKGIGCFVSPKEEIDRLITAEYEKSLKTTIAEGKSKGFTSQELLSLTEKAIKEVYNDKA